MKQKQSRVENVRIKDIEIILRLFNLQFVSRKKYKIQPIRVAYAESQTSNQKQTQIRFCAQFKQKTLSARNPLGKSKKIWHSEQAGKYRMFNSFQKMKNSLEYSGPFRRLFCTTSFARYMQVNFLVSKSINVSIDKLINQLINPFQRILCATAFARCINGLTS